MISTVVLDVDAMDGTESSRSGSSTLFVASVDAPSRVFDASRACFEWSRTVEPLKPLRGAGPSPTRLKLPGTMHRVNGRGRDMGTPAAPLFRHRAPTHVQPPAFQSSPTLPCQTVEDALYKGVASRHGTPLTWTKLPASSREQKPIW